MAKPREIYHAYDRGSVNPLDWDAFVDEQADAWVWQRSWWLDYVKAYDPDSTERSFIITNGSGRIKGIVPLVVHGDRVGYGGHDLCPGLVMDINESMFERNALVAMVFAEMRRRLQDVSAGGWWWWPDAPGARKWMKYCCASFPVQQTLSRHAVLDLTMTVADLRHALRKTYRHIIRDDNHDIRSGDGPGYVATHMRASPGARSDDTYAMQLSWMQAGYGHAVTACQGTRPVAAAYALIDKGWAYYASGPSLVGNAMHAVQWRMILDLKKKGVHTYWLGTLESADQKEENIAFFKKGFSSEVRAVWSAEA
jgi:hypothetical protein